MRNHINEPCTLRDMDYWQDTAQIQSDIDWLLVQVAKSDWEESRKGKARRMLEHVVPSPPPMQGA